MENDRISINQLLKNPEKEIKEARCHLFYDWFCSDTALVNRALKFIPLLQLLVDKGLLDGDSNYVWFKNNCPMDGKLYDDMRISTIENSTFLGGFCLDCGHNSSLKEASFWTIDQNSREMNYNKTFSSYRLMKYAIQKDPEIQKTIREQFNSVAA